MGREKTGTKVNVHGSSNVVALRDVVQIITNRPPATKVVVQPGEAHISDQQAAALKALVDDIVKAESVRHEPKTYPAVWAALNKAMKVPSYRLIPAGSFAKAHGYLQRWRTRLLGTPTAKRMTTDVRRRQIAYIHANMGQGMELQVREYMHRKFNAISPTELTEAQLKQVYAYVAGLKRRREKSEQEQP